MLSEAKKHLSRHYWHQINIPYLEVSLKQRSGWVIITTGLIIKKHSDYLAISLANMVSPVVRSQGYMLMTTEVGIIQQNQSMLVVT